MGYRVALRGLVHHGMEVGAEDDGGGGPTLPSKAVAVESRKVWISDVWPCRGVRWERITGVH